MRKFRRYMLLLPLMVFAASGCLRIEEEDMGPAEQLVPLTFEAVMEDNQTKTALGGGLGDAYRNLTWLPEDTIAISTDHQWSGYYKFSNINTEPSETGNFTGEIPESGTYYAVYPYSAVNSWNDNGRYLQIRIPNKQVYAENTFATDMNPMVARATRGEVLQFKNLCGLLAINLKSENNDVVKSVSLAAYDANGNLIAIAGDYDVSMDFNYEDGPVLINNTAQTSMILMDCGDGVQLSATPTPFHFVLAPGEYSKISVIVTTTDGKTMFKEGKNPLTINRAEWISAGLLKYTETEPINISENGTANSYMISKPGKYSFDATVIGNGEFGIVPNAGFHTSDPKISPSFAELLWQDKEVLTRVSYDGGKISFISTGTEGNALIAAKDADKNVLWSWHIWVTDVPQDHVYKVGDSSYTVQDRNLGAIANERGSGDEGWLNTIGLEYQWGRKDPFHNQYMDTTWESYFLHDAIKNPTIWSYYWQRVENQWTPVSKTIYDPCPVGYRVAPSDIWIEFSMDKISGAFDKGWSFTYNGSDLAWYPAPHNGGSYASMMSSTFGGGLYFNSETVSLQDNSTGVLRCMKDEETATSLVSLTGITSVTSSSALLSGTVSVYGDQKVDDRGFVYGLSPDPTLSEHLGKLTAEDGTGLYTAVMKELSPETKYYVRAYATLGDNTIYSNNRSFTTPSVGDVTNLSAAGTANSYMISHAGTYKFRADVKGNGAAFVSKKSASYETQAPIKASEESTTLNPVEAVVLWQTLNTMDPVPEGAVISSVSLENGYVTFSTSESFTPGNAVIAVKANGGKIIWSWHIWAVDSDPELDAQLYQSGAMMMDRNLGALNVTPGDVRSYGLLYQWGRKDPFVGSGDLTNSNFAVTYPAENAITFVENSGHDTYLYAVAHPNEFIKGSGWNDDEDYWSDHKTMYDPCPVGWRIPDDDAGVWDGFSISRIHNGGYFDSPMSSPAAYYPYAGYISLGTMAYVNSGAYMWKANLRSVFSVESNSGNAWSDHYNGLSVRCMKDAEFTVTTVDTPVSVSDTYAELAGGLRVDDGTLMDEKGIIIIKGTSGGLRVGKSDCILIEADNAAAGDFTVAIAGLEPNTYYRYRAYAKGGYNIRYGGVYEFYTKGAADNEGFGSEDFDWTE